eukprot:scaffold8963_cov63-Cyclotella_meneghiniana.AAC.8
MPTEEGQSRTELNVDRMVATGEAYSSEAAAARVGAETSMENTCNKVESGNNLQPAAFRIIRDSESIQHSTREPFQVHKESRARQRFVVHLSPLVAGVVIVGFIYLFQATSFLSMVVTLNSFNKTSMVYALTNKEDAEIVSRIESFSTNIDIVSLTVEEDFFVLFNNSAIRSWVRHIQNIQSITFIGRPQDEHIFWGNMTLHYPDFPSSKSVLGSRNTTLPTVRFVNQTHWEKKYKDPYPKLGIMRPCPYYKCVRPDGCGDGLRVGHHHILFQHDIMKELHNTVTQAWKVQSLWDASNVCFQHSYFAGRVAEYLLYYAFVLENYPERIRQIPMKSGVDVMDSGVCEEEEMKCCRDKHNWTYSYNGNGKEPNIFTGKARPKIARQRAHNKI